jgi:hypothetical protein
MKFALLLFTFAFWFAPSETITFDGASPGRLPPGWVPASTNPPSQWEIRNDGSAPSKPNVLAETSKEHSATPLAIWDRESLANGEISVHFKPVSGTESAGLVWRYRDPRNFYLVRANAVHNNIVLYKVEDGHWQWLAPRGTPAKTYGVKHKIPSGEWSILKVAFRGDRYQVYFDRRKVFEVQDSTFLDRGKVGLWSKSESVTLFDNFQVVPR